MPVPNPGFPTTLYAAFQAMCRGYDSYKPLHPNPIATQPPVSISAFLPVRPATRPNPRIEWLTRQRSGKAPRRSAGASIACQPPTSIDWAKLKNNWQHASTLPTSPLPLDDSKQLGESIQSSLSVSRLNSALRITRILSSLVE
jgi:hypothetical protein